MKGSVIGVKSAMESRNTISVPGEHGMAEGVVAVHEPSPQGNGAELTASALASLNAVPGLDDAELPWIAR